MKNILHIVAHGARTPVGLTAESVAAAVRAGICRIEIQLEMIDTLGEPVRSARDAEIENSVRGPERLLALLRPTIQEVVTTLDHNVPRRATTDLFLSLPETRPGWSNRDIETIEEAVRQIEGPGQSRLVLQAISLGHAGGLDALARAKARFDRRETDLCLIAGTDSYWDAHTIDALQDDRRLATAETRDGFEPGEGSGCIALTTPSACRGWRLSPLASVVGTGSAQERNLLLGDRENFGEGLTAAISTAAKDLSLPDQAVDVVYCDFNGERYRSEEWAFASLRSPLLAKDPTRYYAPAECWGDVGAASGVLLSILVAESWRRGYAVGPRALIFAGSDRGLRAAAILEAPN